MRTRLLFGLVVVLALGCRSNGFVPVSGKVTMDGKPLAGAVVMFLPVAQQGSIDGGYGSIGTTDENGEYTLKGTDGSSGAQVGHYQVSITKRSGGGAVQDPEDDRRTPRGGTRNEVPAKYSDKTTLTFDVPPGGTSKADFPLQSK